MREVSHSERVVVSLLKVSCIGPLEKLTSLLEDIFEAEDTLPADADLDSLSTEFFSLLTAEPARPQLHHNMIRKLTKYIGQVARPMKRLRGHGGHGGDHCPSPIRTSWRGLGHVAGEARQEGTGDQDGHGRLPRRARI